MDPRESFWSPETALEPDTYTVLALRADYAVRQVAAERLRELGAARLDETADFNCGWFKSPRAAVTAATAVTAAEPSLSAGLCTGEVWDPLSELSLIDRASGTAGTVGGGQIALCLSTYELVRRGLSHGFAVVELGSIAVGVEGTQERVFALRREVDATTQSLPTLTMSSDQRLFGRHQDLEEIRGFMDLARVVTILGAAGIGKTVLAKRLLAEREDSHQNGATWVNFTRLTHEFQILPTLARALDVPSTIATDLLGAIRFRLAAEDRLIVLDGVEGVSNALSVILEDLTAHCTNVLFLVTSQQSLRLPNGMEHELGGLEVPAPGEGLESIRTTAAIELFVEQARRKVPQYELNTRSAATVGQLVRFLDGHPQAISMAADRIELFTPRQILGRLKDLPLSILRTKSEPNPAMERTIAASARLCTDAGQRLFEVLSGFEGAFNLEAVVAVGAAAKLTPSETARVLQELVDSRLVRPLLADLDERYFYLPSVNRLIARAHLEASPVRAATMAAIVRWRERLVGDLAGKLATGDALAYERMDTMYEDVREYFLRSFADRRRAATAAEHLANCLQYWIRRGLTQEGETVVSTAIKSRHVGGLSIVPRLANGLIIFSNRRGDFETARTLGRGALRQAMESANVPATARLFNSLSQTATELGRHHTAARLSRLAIQAFVAGGEVSLVPTVQIGLASCLIGLERRQEAEELLNSILASLDGPAAAWQTVSVRLNRARLRMRNGEFRLAWEDLMASVDAADSDQLGRLLSIGAWVAFESERIADARRLASLYLRYLPENGVRLGPRRQSILDDLLSRLGPIEADASGGDVADLARQTLQAIAAKNY